MSNEVREDAWLRRNPPHPGPGILNGVDGMTLGEAAKRLGVFAGELVALGQCPLCNLARNGAKVGASGMGNGGYLGAATGRLRLGASTPPRRRPALWRI